MSDDKFYVIRCDFDENVLMAGGMPRLPKPFKDSWMKGQAFTIPPTEPLMVGIREGEQNKPPVHFYGNPQIASNEFIEALLEVGVDNLHLYDVILKSRECDKQITGYKGFNIIGLAKAASADTKFATESREGDASIESYQPNPEAMKGQYMFRLAESWRTIVVHEKVKNHLEAKGFKNLAFTPLEGAFIL
ncbi:hypothetical protein CXF85_09195 [Colwellia sp. 75C3]|uniref:hypothetical protein n=1 Tax=Colwellia sp. 75C3 TaxID=888425 RepID=UPI000C33F613|nr:hypothetical protein [Colwellia sp. 75C3]PKG84085.1 hypothetical protein CXF85_09195 [Colwellia sp. 75C3]